MNKDEAAAREQLMREKGFAHPYKGTCSGWKQGYDDGIAHERARSSELIEALAKYLRSRKVVNKELDWDALESLESAISKYGGEVKG